MPDILLICILVAFAIAFLIYLGDSLYRGEDKTMLFFETSIISVILLLLIFWLTSAYYGRITHHIAKEITVQEITDNSGNVVQGIIYDGSFYNLNKEFNSKLSTKSVIIHVYPKFCFGIFFVNNKPTFEIVPQSQ